MTTTSGQNNFTKRLHRSRTWTVQSYSLGGANVHPHLRHASLDRPESIPQTASRLVQPFLHSSELAAESLQSPCFTVGRSFPPSLKITTLFSWGYVEIRFEFNDCLLVLFAYVYFVFRFTCCIIVTCWSQWSRPGGIEAWSLALLLSSVLWHCWLGHLTHKNPSPIWPIMCLVGR